MTPEDFIVAMIVVSAVFVAILVISDNDNWPDHPVCE